MFASLVSIMYIIVEIYTDQLDIQRGGGGRKGPENDDKGRGHTACEEIG